MKLAGIAALGAFDPGTALDLLQNGETQRIIIMPTHRQK